MNIYAIDEIVDTMRNTGPHRLDHHVIIVIISGNAVVRLDNIDHSVKKNDLLFIAPNTIRKTIEVDQATKGLSVSFTDDFLLKQGIYQSNICPFDSFSPNSTHRISLPDEDASMLVSTLNFLSKKNTRNSNHPFGKEVVLHDFNSLLFEIAALYKKFSYGIKAHISRKDEIYTRFLKLLPANFKEHRNLKFYAEQLFVTPNYLTKIVKEIVGKTAGDLIDEMVTIEAKVLLQQTSLSVSEIAGQLYFSDPFMFSKFFKKQTGSSPSVFRKTAIEPAI